MSKAVFLDRDGVINDAVIKQGKPYPPAGLQELHIAKDAPQALQLLKAAGFILIVVTNQPDVARGTTTQSAVEAINQHLLNTLPLETIRVCYHDNEDQCSCRKPKPGLLLEAVRYYDIDRAQSFMVGDRAGDIEAGHAAGCKTIWLNRGYQERGPQVAADFETSTLLQAAHWIISTEQRKCQDEICERIKD